MAYIKKGKDIKTITYTDAKGKELGKILYERSPVWLRETGEFV